MSTAPVSRISRPAAALLAVLLVGMLAVSASTREASGQGKRVFNGHARPLATFVPNTGEFRSPEVRYVAQGAGYAFAFTPQQVGLSFARQSRITALSLRFVNADPGVKLEAHTRLPGKVNYLIGRDPTNWRTGLPTYRELVYRGLWPGIDLHVRGEPGRLKYEFHVRAGADPRRIRLAYRGARGLSLTRAGALAISTPFGTLTDARPLSYQRVGRRIVPIATTYSLRPRSGYSFALGRYESSRPLVIDPGIEYSTYLGGGGSEGGSAIAVEGGYAYVSGCTVSDDFPTTPGAFQTIHDQGGDYPLDVFVTKLSKNGSLLLYSTFLGGSDIDCLGNGIAVEGGRAYVAGNTISADFPTTPGAFQRTFGGGGGDGFVAELSKDGAALVYSTYLGGSGSEQGNDIAVESGNAYVTGPTDSPDFPTTPGAFQRTTSGTLDVFVTKLAKDGSALVYSTGIGGSDDEESDGIAIEGGRAYLTGLTRSSEFPTTRGAFQRTYAGGDDDAFVTEVSNDGSALGYSTFLGGSNGDHGVGIAVQGGKAYVTGITGSTDFPTTPSAFQPAYGGGFRDAFAAKLDRRGNALGYSTYLGGHSNDAGHAIAVEGGRAYVTGLTGTFAGGPGEDDFPTTADAAQPVFGGLFDAFVTKLAGDASSFEYSTYLGGGDWDEGDGIAVEGDGAYVTGAAGSGFRTTADAFQRTFAGGDGFPFTDAFVTKLKTD